MFANMMSICEISTTFISVEALSFPAPALLLFSQINEFCLLPRTRIRERVRLEGNTVGHLAQAPCSNMVIPEMASQDCVQMAFGYLQGRRFHNHSGQSAAMLSHLHSKVLPRVQVEFCGTSCGSVYFCFLFICKLAPPRRARILPLGEHSFRYLHNYS